MFKDRSVQEKIILNSGRKSINNTSPGRQIYPLEALWTVKNIIQMAGRANDFLIDLMLRMVYIIIKLHYLHIIK